MEPLNDNPTPPKNPLAATATCLHPFTRHLAETAGYERVQVLAHHRTRGLYVEYLGHLANTKKWVQLTHCPYCHVALDWRQYGMPYNEWARARAAADRRVHTRPDHDVAFGLG